MKKNSFQTMLLAVILFGLTTLIYLYTAGYRLDKEPGKIIDLKHTGMVGVKSIPDGAKVYLDGELVTATDNTISAVNPGTHKTTIIKNGYVTWSKDIEVFPELVTDITAILIPQSPRLEPLTNTGARGAEISPSLTKLAFFSADASSPGIWIIPLTNTGINLFRSGAQIVVEDSAQTLFSLGKTIKWSPDEDEILVQTAKDQYFLIDIATKKETRVTNLEKLEKDWQQKLLKKRLDFIERIDIPEDLKELAVSEEVVWAPDTKKFMYKRNQNGNIEYIVYNMEKPIPIGEKVESLVLSLPETDPQPQISWYSDSFHLILTEGNIETDKNGKISLIRIDGTNKTEIYNNTLWSDKVYSSPNGDKLIILTTFKSGELTDLYTLGIR
jgi:hypothetical protein